MPTNCATASMAARSKPRSCWRSIRSMCARTAIADFKPDERADREGSSPCCRRSGRRRSPGRRRTSIRAARSAMRPRLPPRRARSCSSTARARSASCSKTSTGLMSKNRCTAGQAGFAALGAAATKQFTKPYFGSGVFEPEPKRLRPTGMRTTPAPRSNRMEYPMSIKTKFAALALAALAVTGTIASTTSQAEAKPYRLGLGRWCGPGRCRHRRQRDRSQRRLLLQRLGRRCRRCGFVRQFDAYGNYIGRVRTCYSDRASFQRLRILRSARVLIHPVS